MRSAFRQERKKERKNGPGACALAQMGEYANRKPLSKWRITPPAKQMAVLRIFGLKKMNRLALQNPPRQTEKRQCPVFSCLPVNGRQEKRRTLNAPDGATACA
ncbi:hypothetical protein [uncultured Ottowia sp.]|uniref:hypothetical protein n=1 Tax=uncultured Ottowia sp. TaxID=543067 RepID=UPI0025969323|nr:hypothetical protein [uncultured Ottowia sp.]